VQTRDKIRGWAAIDTIDLMSSRQQAGTWCGENIPGHYRVHPRQHT